MASEFVDLVSQVNNILNPINGGTGNDASLSAGTILYQENRTGSTIPVYSTVTFSSRNIVLTTQDSQVPVLGVVIGELSATTSRIIPGDVPGGTYGHTAVVVTAGVVPMIFDAIQSGTGDYVYTSGTTPGHVYSKTTRGAGAIGILVSGAGFFSAPTTYLVAMWSGVSLAGPLHVSAEGVNVNSESDSMDFLSVLPIHAFGHTTAVDIAPELLGGLVAAQVAFTYGTPGTTIVRPTSDALTIPLVTYSSGTTGWNLVNGTSHSPSSYYTLASSPFGTLVHGYANPGLDYTYRVDSVMVSVYRDYGLSGPNASLVWRDPSTGQTGLSGNFVPGAGYITATYTSRPWDSRPWTLSDLPHLQFGVESAGGVEQVFLTIAWTKIVTVADELVALIGGGDIWRPLLASDGTIITAGPGGEAVMGFGPP